MRRTITVCFAAFVIGHIGPGSAQVTEIYRCISQNGRPFFTVDKRDMENAQSCELVARENVVPPQAPQVQRPSRLQLYNRDPKYRAKVDKFRSSMKIGDKADSGLVVELKPPLALLQASTGVRWFRMDELFPQD